MLLSFAGETLVHRAVRRAVDAGLLPVFVVLGHAPDAVRAAVADLPCRFARNPDYAGPTSSSLHCGIRALPADAAAAVIMLADMPFVTTEMIARLVSPPHRSAPLAASRYGDVIAPPLRFDRAFFDELLACEGEGSGKKVVLRHAGEAAFVDWPAVAGFDIDTPEDLAAITPR